MNVLFLSSHHLGEKAARFTWEIQGDHKFSWGISNDKLDFSRYNDPYDLGVSFLYNHLIPANQIKDKNWINFHPAPLPEYRGRNVAYHAIMNGETMFGATLHYVDKTFDTGDIIDEFKFSIRDGDNAGDVAELARDECFNLFKEWIPRFLNGEKPIGHKQVGGMYYKKQPIDPFISSLTLQQQKEIRAITAPPHYPKTRIGGIEYAIIPTSELYHSDDESSGVTQTNTDESV